MTSAITKRILWKEFRTQRGLWGALLLCTVLFQLLVLVLADDEQATAQMTHVIGVLLMLCYAAGSGAISFASEREEETQLRLQTLACPPIWTVTLKLAYAVLSSLVMAGLFLASAWLLSGHSIVSLFLEGPSPQSPQALLGIGWVVFVFLSILLWTMFFSLLTRTVLFAIGLGAVGTFVFIWTVGITILELLPRKYNPPNVGVSEVLTLFCIESIFLLVVVGMNCVLAGRWFRQFAGDAPKVKRFSLLRRFRIRASRGGGSFVLKIGTELSHVDEVLSPREAATQPCPRAGLSWLYLAWGSRTWRTLRFLRWREAHESRWRFMLFFAVCLVFTQSFAWQILHVMNLAKQAPGVDPNEILIRSPLWTFFATVILAFITGCGVMSFRQEHAGEQFRVLRDRGVPAGHLWLSKHFVWGTRVFLGTVVILVAAGMVADDFVNGTHWLLSFAFGFHREFRIGELPLPVLIWRGLLVTSLFYSAGQVTSLIFKRMVIAFFMGVMLIIFLSILAAVSLTFGIPLGWSLLPLVPGALMITLLRCRSWMLDQTGFRSWMPTGIVAAVACLLCFAQSSLHRMWEYPDVDPQSVYAKAYPLTQGEQTFESLEAEVAPFLARQQPTAVARYGAELYHKASDKLRPTDASLKSDFARDFSQPVAFADFTAEQRLWLNEEAAALKTTLTAACREECSFWSGGSLNRRRFPEFIQEQAALVIASALQLEADGQVEEALDRFELALNISRHLGSDGGAFSFSESRNIAISVYAQMRQWAGNPQVTPRLAGRAVSMIRAHQQSLGSLTVMNVIEHRAIRSWLASFDSYAAEAFSADAILYLGFIHHLPGERTREQRIINLLETRLAKEFFDHRRVLAGGSRAGQTAATHNGSGVSLPIDVETYSQIFRTTPQLRDLISDLRTVPRNAAFECEQAARATELTIRMLSTSREKGTPLNPEDHPARCRVDVWSGQDLKWYPNGIHSEFRISGTTIPVGRPFLWGGGVAQAQLVESSHQEVTAWRERPATQEDRDQGASIDIGVMNLGGEGPSMIREPTEYRTVYSYKVRDRTPGKSDGPRVYLFPRRTPGRLDTTPQL
jgi:hypothetical protein